MWITKKITFQKNILFPVHFSLQKKAEDSRFLDIFSKSLWRGIIFKKRFLLVPLVSGLRGVSLYTPDR